MAIGTEDSRPSTLAAIVTSTGLIGQQVAGKAIRDALFLSSFQAKHLPHAMAATSAVSLLSVAVVGALNARYSPQRLLPLLFGGSGILFVLEWLLFALTRRGGAFSVYMHTAVLGPVLITMFWSLVNERYDPHSAKAAMARIAGGGTLGGVLGGIAAWRASTLVSLPAAVLILAATHLMCAFTVLGVSGKKRTQPSLLPEGTESDASPLSALRQLRAAPYLRNLAILVGMGAMISSLLDYVLGVQAVARFGKSAELLTFFSLFGLGVAIVSLAIQLTLGRLAMQKLALAVHIALLPGVVVLGGAVGLAVPGLLSAIVLRGLEMVHRNTLFRSAYELLYTPVPERQKRATKAVIDVGFDRAGTILGSLVTMGVIYALGGRQTVILALVVVFAASTFPVVRNLHRGYVDALEERLREGAAKLEAPIPSERLGPVSASPAAEAARDGMIRSAELLTGRVTAGIEKDVLEHPEELSTLGIELLSRDATRTKAALARLDVGTRAVAGHAILLVADPEVQRDARIALTKLAPAIVGQLVDGLVAQDIDVKLRRHLAPVLVGAPGQRAADGLLGALDDPRFEIRYAAGRSLARVVELKPDVVLPRERIIAVIVHEAARAEQVVSAQEDESDLDAVAAPLDIVIRDRVSRGLEHLFTMLSLLLEHDALRLCYRALHQDDDRYRGTALEYLETVLPAEVRDAIWPLLGAADGPLPSQRASKDLIADLTKAIQLEPMKNG